MSLRINEVSTGKGLNIADKARINIQATPGEKYHLIDQATGQTPKDLEVLRQGDNLYLHSAQHDVEIVIEQFWEACQPGADQCYALFDTPEYVGGELIGQTIVTQEGEVLGTLLAGEIGTLGEGAVLGVWGAVVGSSAWIPSLLAVTGGLAAASALTMFKSLDYDEEAVIVNNAQSPTLQVNNDGSATVGAPKDSKSLTVDYIKPDGTQATLTLNKGADDRWTSNNPETQVDPQNPAKAVIAIDPITGEVSIPETLLQGSSKIKAAAIDDNGNNSVPVQGTIPPTLTVVAPDQKIDNTPLIEGNSTAPAGTDVLIILKDTNGSVIQTLSTQVQSNGRYAVQSKPLPVGNYQVTAQVRIKNDKGDDVLREASDPGSVAAQPTVEMTVPQNNTNGQPDIVGKSAPGNSEVTLTITDSANKVQEITVKTNPDGRFKVTVPEKMSNGDYTVTAQAKDANGNISKPINEMGNIDNTAPEVSLTVPENTNDNTPAIKGKAPANSEVTLTITDSKGEQQTINTKADANGDYAVDVPKTLADGVYTVHAEAKDPATGKIGSANDQGNIDTVAPTLNISLPNNTADTTPLITGSSNAPFGTTVNIEILDKDGKLHETLNATIKANGSYAVEVKKPLVDGSYTAKATVTDLAGNTQSAEKTGNIDNAVPEVSLTVPENTNDNTPAIKGKAPANSEVTLTITDSKGEQQTINTKADANGDYAVDVPKTLADGVYTVHAEAKDPATGKIGSANDQGNIDTIAPTIDLDAPDSRNPKPTIKGNTQNAPEGSVVVIELVDSQGNQQSAQGKINADGTFSIPLTQALSEGKYTAKATVINLVGNKGYSSDPGIIDSKAPSKPILTAHPDGTVDVQMPHNANPKDFVEVKVLPENGNAAITVTLTKNPDGSWTSDNPTVIPNIPKGENATKIPANQVKDGSLVHATAKDPLGNFADADPVQAAVVDSSAPNGGNAPSVEIITDANDDGFINRAEMGDKKNITVKIGFNKDKVDIGDIVVSTDKTDPNNPVIKEILIDATAKANGYVEVDFPKAPEGSDIVITGSLKDSANNKTSVAEDKAKLDTSNLSNNPAGNGVAVKIVNDQNNDDLINQQELGIDKKISVQVNLPKEAVAGDLLNITGTDNVAKIVELKASDIATGMVTVVFNAPADGTKFVTTAKVSDLAGNESNTAQDQATIDATAPNKPIVTPNSQDGGATVKPSATEPGDILQISYKDENNQPQNIKLQKKADNTWDVVGTLPDGVTHQADGTVNIPQNAIKDSSTISAIASDIAGNSATETGNVGANTSDATISIHDPIAQDNIINAQEDDQAVIINGSSKNLPNDTNIVVSINNVEYNAKTDASGNWTVSMPVADVQKLQENTEYSVSAKATDPLSNSKILAKPVNISRNTTAPDAPNVQIGNAEQKDSLDEVTYDEVKQNGTPNDLTDDTVSVQVKIPNNAQAGDEIKIVLDNKDIYNKPLTTEDIQNGLTIDIPVPTKTVNGKVVYDEGGNINISASIINSIGNSSKPGEDSAILSMGFQKSLTQSNYPENLGKNKPGSYSEIASIAEGTAISNTFLGGVKKTAIIEGKEVMGTESADGFYFMSEKSKTTKATIYLTPKGSEDTAHGVNDYEQSPNNFLYNILATYADGAQKIGQWEGIILNRADIKPIINAPQPITDSNANIIISGKMQNNKGLPENETLFIVFNGGEPKSIETINADGTWRYDTGIKAGDLGDGSYKVKAYTDTDGNEFNSVSDTQTITIQTSSSRAALGEEQITAPVDDATAVQIYAQDGNDVIYLDRANHTIDNTKLVKIDGGAGENTLMLSGTGFNLDMTLLDAGKIININTIDLTGTGGNYLKLGIEDVADMAGEGNLLKVTGTADDQVDLSSANTAQLTGQEVIDNISYNSYDIDGNGSNDILIQSGVGVGIL